MKLIKQTGPYCLVASAAMCLDVSIAEIHAFIGHDGTEIWWPPNGMRGVHIQEIQAFARMEGFLFAPVEIFPLTAPDHDSEPRPIYSITESTFKFMALVSDQKGILITPNHAVAFEDRVIYDPKGFTKSWEDEPKIREAWVLTRVI